jgi:hypothetical protein
VLTAIKRAERPARCRASCSILCTSVMTTVESAVQLKQVKKARARTRSARTARKSVPAAS